MPSRKQLANAVRVLSMDAIQKANSGHPGAPMGMADIAEALWNHVLKHNPVNPGWFDRDRFVLSNGHGSMLLYSLLHLTGYDLSMDEIEKFRQMGSETPGHPEYGDTAGVETTTGPLGQGICNAVGMALAERALAAEFNRDGHEIVDHWTYTFLGDGCMMEGVSHEACSLAGTMGLGKLVAFWDDNGISIDGEVTPWWRDDTPARFEAYGWHVVRGVDGHDAQALDKAIAEARSVTDKPSLVCCKTIIGCGAPNEQGKHTCHGSPLGDAEIAETRKALGWDAAPFVMPEDIYEGWNAREKGALAEAQWNEKFEAYENAFPAQAAEFTRRMNNELPVDWATKAAAIIAATNNEAEILATRKASQAAIKKFAELLPEFLGGSADLTPSNGTRIPAYESLVPGDFSGRYISYGVREFGMGAIMNGVALHGGLLPYGGTFLIFSDYARNAIRMAALMGLRVIWVLTHDSIGVGEDGPTHQPVEQIPSLRLIPELDVWRPCDTVETAVAWKEAVESAGPSCLALTRQTTGFAQRDAAQLADVEKGGYVLDDCDGTPDAILIGSGSEVFLAVEAKRLLQEKGRKIRVVSMPCTERFDGQDKAYRDAVLPPAVTARVAVEAAATDGWYKYVGLGGAVIGMRSFGASAPGGQLFTRFGFTPRAVAETVESVL